MRRPFHFHFLSSARGKNYFQRRILHLLSLLFQRCSTREDNWIDLSIVYCKLQRIYRQIRLECTYIRTLASSKLQIGEWRPPKAFPSPLMIRSRQQTMRSSPARLLSVDTLPPRVKHSSSSGLESRISNAENIS